MLVPNRPSLTVSVMVAVPVCPAAGVIVTVRLAPVPPNTMLALGTRVRFDELLLTVIDDGAPRTGSATGEGIVPGRGLRGMRDRVEQAGGRFESGPAEHGGWRVVAAFPLPEASDG